MRAPQPLSFSPHPADPPPPPPFTAFLSGYFPLCDSTHTHTPIAHTIQYPAIHRTATIYGRAGIRATACYDAACVGTCGERERGRERKEREKRDGYPTSKTQSTCSLLALSLCSLSFTLSPLVLLSLPFSQRSLSPAHSPPTLPLFLSTLCFSFQLSEPLRQN